MPSIRLLAKRGFVRADVHRDERGRMLVCVIERDESVSPPEHLAAVGLIAETALQMLQDHGAAAELIADTVMAGLKRRRP